MSESSMSELSKRQKERLKNDYLDFKEKSAGTDLYTWASSPGEKPPYVSSYIVTYKVPTLVNDNGTLRKQNPTHVKIIRNGNVWEARVTNGSKPPFHPNWWESGAACAGTARNETIWLIDFVAFIGEMLQFRINRIRIKDQAYVKRYWEKKSPATKYFENNISKFPLDTREFPTWLSKPKHKIEFTPL